MYGLPGGHCDIPSASFCLNAMHSMIVEEASATSAALVVPKPSDRKPIFEPAGLNRAHHPDLPAFRAG
jgi:hypothetical protein